ncbi:Fic family protein, partial [Candidatus Poribacteria bacterium]|nr:Fic family protein [Candidatus Poribacteria bacterium]
MKNFIAGQYKQHQEYESFTPSLINGLFEWKNPKINVLLEQAGNALGELNGYAELLPDVDFFIKMNVAKEARDSNLIEGTKTELDDILLSREDIDPEKRDDWDEVQNYIRATNFAISKLSELPLCMRLLKEAHKILLSGVRGKHKAPGEIRKIQNRIGGSSLSNAFFVPPSPEELPDLLSDLEKFWHNQSLQIPVLIKIAITHYQFETIHPFLDGNGRCGRLLIILQLIDAQILNKPVLYMSTFFERHRASYYDSLSIVRSSNDLEQWIVFFLHGIIETAKHGIEKFRKIVSLRQEYDEQILKLGSRTKNAHRLLRFMFAQPIISVNSAAEELEMVF